MNTLLNHRSKRDIDRRLERLLGQDVRVAAKSFLPPSRPGSAPLRFIPVRDLYLPDNSQPAGLPVFFEGRLQQFERQIGVVLVCLDAPASLAASSEGAVFFRGKAAVILRGPAVLELAFPFHVEKLPTEPDNYWRDLRAPRAQFEFAFSPDQVAGAEHPDRAVESPIAVISRGYVGTID